MCCVRCIGQRMYVAAMVVMSIKNVMWQSILVEWLMLPLSLRSTGSVFVDLLWHILDF